MEVFLYLGKIDKFPGKTTISCFSIVTHLCTVNLKLYKMTVRNKSIFNLIEIFSQGRKKVINSIHPKKHCEQKGLHDFYCNTEMIFVKK